MPDRRPSLYHFFLPASCRSSLSAEESSPRAPPLPVLERDSSLVECPETPRPPFPHAALDLLTTTMPSSFLLVRPFFLASVAKIAPSLFGPAGGAVGTARLFF